MQISIMPVVCESGRKARFTLRGLSPGGSYRIALLPVFERARLDYAGTADESGCLAWEQGIAWKGEALCDISFAGGDHPLATLHLYAVSGALAGRRPMRCDFHLHTFHSDGRQSPAEMVVRGREVGLDALAITDHNKYAGSLEGIEAGRRLGLGLVLFPGEEVTSPTWHLVSINASAGIGYSPAQAGYPGLRWSIDRIHELGGKAYLAHPYWVSNRHLNQPASEYERVLVDGGLDGIEVLGEVPWEENLRSVARYYELDPARRPPILGNSDAHHAGASLPGAQPVAVPIAGQSYGAYWTLVLASQPTGEAILEAIEQGVSAACARMLLAPETFPVQPKTVAFGSFELVDLAIFLEAHYFPRHDAICRQEADAARRILAGEPTTGAVERLEAELESFYRESWGSG